MLQFYMEETLVLYLLESCINKYAMKRMNKHQPPTVRNGSLNPPTCGCKWYAKEFNCKISLELHTHPQLN